MINGLITKQTMQSLLLRVVSWIFMQMHSNKILTFIQKGVGFL